MEESNLIEENQEDSEFEEVEEIQELFVPEKEVENIEKEKEFVDVLRMVAPGTSLRTALDDLLRARMGALIVFENEYLSSIVEKGFKINCKFSYQRLVELCKMDGAIILSKDGKKILYANSLLIPSSDISTNETGTRHKAAQRTARQAKTISIAVSERKNKISIFYQNHHHILEKSSDILRKATETLQILDRQKEAFNDLLNNLNLLELTRSVTIKDVSIVLQRAEIVKRISDIIKKYLIELGQEGVIIRMRLKELIGNVNRDQEIILRDYFGNEYSYYLELLEKMNFDFLLEPMNISRMLFEELHDKSISPRGLRILSKTNLLERYVDSLINHFKTLDRILVSHDGELIEILESEAMVDFFRQELYNLKEKISIGKRI